MAHLNEPGECGVHTTPSKAVLITGCSTGIGRATAIAFAQAGWPTYATARRVESISDLESYGCLTLPLDVTDTESIQSAVDTVKKAHGSVGVLVNNAGYALHAALESLPVDAVRRQFETNVFGSLEVTNRVLPAMREHGSGHIFFVGSIAGTTAVPSGGAYCASKHALEAICDALRFEVRQFGVRVVLIKPGPVSTNFGITQSAANEREIVDPGPYAEFNSQADRIVAEQHDSLARLLGCKPEWVANVIVHAATTSRPHSRYLVTRGAHIARFARRALPDSAWDRIMSIALTAPRPTR